MKTVLTDAELGRLQVLLHGTAGLVFEGSRRDSLGYCLGERLRATGDPDVAAYLLRVEAPGSPELQPLLDEVTIQETHFFRNPPQARALRQHVLPELVREASARGRRVRIWSAGCSTGDEPYSIAMVLRELLPSTAGWDLKVIATDISAGALAHAREGTYGPRALRLASPEQLARFFVPVGGGRHRVRPEVRELVEFRHGNLVLDPPPGDGLDLVLCRNVTIYFDRDTTRDLVRRLHGSLRDGGYLFLGHSETLWQVSEDFRLVTIGTGEGAAFAYRRLDDRRLDDRRLDDLTERRAVLPDRGPAPEAPLPGARPEPASARALPVSPQPPGPVGWRGSVGPPVPPGPDAHLASATAPIPRARSAPCRATVAAPGPDLDAVRAALAAGRYDDAARLARLLAAHEPLVADGHYLLGRALVESGHDDQALPALRRAVYLAPHAGLAHFLLAGALARCGDPAAAAREYRAAAQTLGRDPDEAAAPELGGRSARELAALCAQLEGQLIKGTA